MKESVSPEEKLLRLIRGKKKFQSASPQNTSPSAASSMKATRSLKTFTYLFPGINLKLSSIGGILFWIFIFSCAFFLSIVIYSVNTFKDISSAQQAEIELPPLPSPKEEKPIDYYISSVKERNIFPKPVVAETTEVKTEQPINTDFIKDINLVGIFWGNNPQAAIEDKRTQKTYYVSAGENVADCKVETIEEGKVVLNYKGQQFELFL